MYNYDMRVTTDIKFIILERAGHICSKGGSRTNKRDRKREKYVVVDRQGS